MGTHTPWLKDVQTRFREELVNCTPLNKKTEVFRFLDEVRGTGAFSYQILKYLPREIKSIFDELTHFAHSRRMEPEELIYTLIQNEHLEITYGLNRRSEEESFSRE